MPNFPEILPGGSLILAWQVKGKKVLVVGGGEVCAAISFVIFVCTVMLQDDIPL